MLQSFKMAIRSISGSKMRAFLTMLGIIIGVMALVVLVSLVNGATSSVSDAVSSLGSDLLTVTVSDDKGDALSLEEVEGWKTTYSSVDEIAPYTTTSTTGKYGTSSVTTTVYGVTNAYCKVESQTLSQGRYIKDSDVENNCWVAVINETMAKDLIGYTDCIGEQISLNGMKFTVVGVISEEDTSIMSAIMGGGDTAFVPYTVLPRVSDSVSMDVETFAVSAAEGYNMDQLEAEITPVLYERFDEDDDAYSISSVDIMGDALASVTSVLSILLGGIAAISLVVGGIGIMNIMLVTVTERTREIGIKKAIGATRQTILRQFLLEAILLCMMGCAIGIFLSWTVLRVANVIVTSLSLSFALNGKVVLIAVIFCFLIAVVFGLYPANKAAKMKPIDALHYGG